MSEDSLKPSREYLVDGHDFYISLTKLMGKKIVDIHGYVSDPFGSGDNSFGMAYIVFEDGSTAHVEGEHDWAYVYDIDEDRLEAARDRTYDDEDEGEF